MSRDITLVVGRWSWWWWLIGEVFSEPSDHTEWAPSRGVPEEYPQVKEGSTHSRSEALFGLNRPQIRRGLDEQRDHSEDKGSSNSRPRDESSAGPESENGADTRGKQLVGVSPPCVSSRRSCAL